MQSNGGLSQMPDALGQVSFFNGSQASDASVELLWDIQVRAPRCTHGKVLAQRDAELGTESETRFLPPSNESQ